MLFSLQTLGMGGVAGMQILRTDNFLFKIERMNHFLYCYVRKIP